MDNKRIILWLLLFFPIGIYLMFKESNWSNTIKLGITAFFMMLVMLGGLELMSLILFIGTFVFLFMGGLSFIRKGNYLKSIGLIGASLLLFAGSYSINETIEAEQIAIEQAEIRAQEERDRIAEEERQAEIAKQEELERIEEQKALRVKILSALDTVEAEPTLENYNAVSRILSNLDSKSDVVSRLDKVKPQVDAYEETKKFAIDAIVLAETDQTRSSYDEAVRVVSNLSIANQGLDTRLNKLSRELDAVEAEQLAEEKRIAEVAAEKAAEEKRIAAAAAEKAAEETRVAAAEKSTQQAAVTKPATVQQEAPPADNTEKTVYIAPDSGKKYHFDHGCRGLNNANSVVEISLSAAKQQGLGLCGWED